MSRVGSAWDHVTMATELIFQSNSYAPACEATINRLTPSGIELDRTVFYAEGGGQRGDQGILRTTSGTEVAIEDTIKGESDDSLIHVPAASEGKLALSAGESVTAEIDWNLRYARMRMHTCLHLLSSVLPYPVTGGSVGDGKGRLDFDIPETIRDKEWISSELNRLIQEDRQVTSEWISDEELSANPDLVKTMMVKPPAGMGKIRLIRIEGLDLQPCGGTHVARTGEIGTIVIAKIQKKGRQNRRVSLVFA